MSSDEKLISPVRGKNLNSERNNNFSPEAAIAEVIDNSLEANAKKIKIRILSDKTQPGQRKARPTIIAIGDDGEGMDADGEISTLQQCLVLGQSSRYNSRKGLGRFGVGMTKGAISLCRTVEVYSRQKQGNWNYVKLDLDVQDANGDPGITPVKRVEKLPDGYSDLVGDYGTLVIWTKIDRIESDFSVEDIDKNGRLREGLQHWLERTFRKHIGKQIIKNGKPVDNEKVVSIELDDNGNNRELVAFDPLFFIPNPRRPSDGTSKMDWEDTFPFEVSNIDKPDDPVSEGNITIRMTLTPKEWRKERKHGNSPESRARHLPQNEGISLLRNGREVAYRKIDYWDPVLDKLDRFWSCEIDFDAVLDHQFKVANVKIGAKPIAELREKLIEKTKGTIVENFRKEIQDYWSKQDQGETATKPTPEPPTEVIPPTKPEEITEEEEEKFEGETEWEQIRERISDPKAPGIIPIPTKEMRSSDPIIAPTTVGGKYISRINLMHVWWDRLFEKMEKIKELSKEEGNENEINQEIDNIKNDIFNLMIAMTKSIRDMKDEELSSMEETFETFLFRLSLTLKNLSEHRSSNE